MPPFIRETLQNHITNSGQAGQLSYRQQADLCEGYYQSRKRCFDRPLTAVLHTPDPPLRRTEDPNYERNVKRRNTSPVLAAITRNLELLNNSLLAQQTELNALRTQLCTTVREDYQRRPPHETRGRDIARNERGKQSHDSAHTPPRAREQNRAREESDRHATNRDDREPERSRRPRARAIANPARTPLAKT